MTARTRSLARCVTAGIAMSLAISALPGEAQAETVIKRPGARPDYSVELDPHLVLLFDGPYWADEGFGLGFRASIPIVDDPISTINNNMAIGFGLDWAHHSDDNGCWWWDNRRTYYDGHNCDANSFWVPVVLQWNFWLTDIISVYGEPGIGIRHWRYDRPCGDWDGMCEYHDTDPVMVFYGGARFMFSDTIGLTTRLGFHPLMFNLGASFLL